MRPKGRTLILASLASLAGGCGTVPPAIEREATAHRPGSSATRQPLPPSTRPGGFYKDDGPGEHPPPDVEGIADAVPRTEPLHRFANKPYAVFGVTYTPIKSHAPFRQRGLASWYGRMFHGQRTSSGEPYDMYGMTAAHPTLPIPSYVRVTHVRNGRSVVLRVNDRGPFHPGRIIDLSWAGAQKLGYVREGSALVELELITPEDIARLKLPATAPPDGAVYLQVGAFSAQANAEGLRARLLREMSELTDTAVQVLQAEGAFRVHVGPYRSRSEAAGVAERLRGMFRLNPLFVTR